MGEDMSSPSISIVTPSYNQARYLKDNLDSVSNQRYEAVEHIVLDAGSDDGTVDILSEYQDRYDLWWRSEPDEGQSAAINEGFDRASGDIVGWLNSDDVYLDSGVFDRVVDHFGRTGADVLYGDIAYVDSDSRVTEIDVRPDFDRSKLRYRILIAQPAVFFRSHVLETERLDTELNYCMDYEFWIRLSERFDIRHVRDLLSGFRRHELQKTDDLRATDEEVESMLARYRDSLPRSERNVWPDLIRGEITRTLVSARETVEVSQRPPELAFDGTFAPLREMLANLGPHSNDIRKTLRRKF